MNVSANLDLDPAQSYGPIRIATSGVTIDGHGACLQGEGLRGIGIAAAGVSGVTLRNLRVRGFGLGLQIADAEAWLIENCDFSDNFHDPQFGWGDHEPAGGMLLGDVRGFTIRGCRANRVWDACYLINSTDNLVTGNDFSWASNTCLKLRASCRNEVRANNLSHGIRIAPGEVHARDSCCVLIESGSHENRFLDNDARHGGDGFFVRVLDGRPSSGNLFQGNDASYAHNNCFEAWAPGNTYLDNRANHGSYGFWLGASDRTVLIGNEAGWNGLPSGNHNAPEPGFGHGGIVFVNGSSEHILLSRNSCHHNNGGGIVGRGDTSGRSAFRAFHWLIQQNSLEANRWGIFLQQADWIDVGWNSFADNQEGPINDAGAVSNLQVHPLIAGHVDSGPEPPNIAVRGPSSAGIGERVTFEASGGSRHRWDLGDGTTATASAVEHAYSAAGDYVVGLTAWDGDLADLDWLIVQVR